MSNGREYTDSEEAAALHAVLADPVCRLILERTPGLGLPEWWLTGGAVFQNIWNTMEAREPGYGISDYDLFYFDDSDLSWQAEDRVLSEAKELFGDVGAKIEIRNEARVHLWYEEKFGKTMRPFVNAAEATDSFASATCAVGVTRDERGLRLYAPYGLADVFAMHVRPNHRLAPRGVYEEKVRTYTARWPSLTHDPW
jgi:hypothetical protein